jgi:hypothetical protein
MENPPLKSVDPALVRDAMARRLYRRSVVKGEISLPAVPGMIDEYVTMCDTLFAGVGRRFTAEQLAHVRTVLEGQLAQAYAASPRSMIVVSFNAPVGDTLNYHVKAHGGRSRAPTRIGLPPASRHCSAPNRMLACGR